MSKVRFSAVKELIAEKKYDAARTLLRTINDLEVRDWEERLDKQIERDQLVKEKRARRGDWLRLCIFFAVVVLFFSCANMISPYAAMYSPEARTEAAGTALYTSVAQTNTAYQASNYMDMTGTVVSRIDIQTQTANLIMGTAAANLATSDKYFAPFNLDDTLTPSPTLTPQISTMNPTDYYNLNYVDVNLTVCPSYHDERCNGPTIYFQSGQKIVVLGTAESRDEYGGVFQWYLIQMPGDNTVYYLLKIDLQNYFSPIPPTAYHTRTPTSIPQPRQTSVSNPFAPSRTPRPTPHP